MHWFLKFILGMRLYMFRTVPLSIIRSFSLYTQQWYMSYRFADSLRAGSGCSILIFLASCQQICMTHTIAVFTVKKTPDDGQGNCPKHVEVYSRNKFEKLVHLFGFIISYFAYLNFMFLWYVPLPPSSTADIFLRVLLLSLTLSHRSEISFSQLCLLCVTM